MRHCPNCNKELEDKDLFCYSCGTKFPEKKEEDITEVLFCTNCGNKLADRAQFCGRCGAAVTKRFNLNNVIQSANTNESMMSSKTLEVETEPAVNIFNKDNSKTKKKNGKIWKISIFVILVITAVIVFCLFHFSIIDKPEALDKLSVLDKIAELEELVTADKGQKKAALYIKNFEIYYTDFVNQPVRITKDYIDEKKEKNLGYDLGYYSEVQYHINISKMISEDGDKIAYLDNIKSISENEQGSTDIYYRDMKDKNSEALKIDHSIVTDIVRINNEGDMVTYNKNDGLRYVGEKEDSELYQYYVKTDERVKLASDAIDDDTYISEDGNTIYFKTKENGFYIKEKGKEKEKIGNTAENIYISDDFNIVYFITEEKDLCVYERGKETEKISNTVSTTHISEDFKTIYYLKNKELYEKKLGGENKNIDSEVYQLGWGYNSGEAYYIKSDDTVGYFDGNNADILGKIEKDSSAITDFFGNRRFGTGCIACSEKTPIIIFRLENTKEYVLFEKNVLKTKISGYIFEVEFNDVNSVSIYLEEEGGINVTGYEARAEKGYKLERMKKRTASELEETEQSEKAAVSKKKKLNKWIENHSEPKDVTAKDTIYLTNFDYDLKPYTADLYLYREGKSIKVDSGVNGGLDDNFEHQK